MPALVGPYWEKLCPRSWARPSACGLGPYSRPLAQFFSIRTSRPANNIYVFAECPSGTFGVGCKKKCKCNADNTERCHCERLLPIHRAASSPLPSQNFARANDPTGYAGYANQCGKKLGDEMSSLLFKRCVMPRRTGTSALSALPVRLVAGKIYISTNRKSHFLSLFFSQPCTMVKTFFHSSGSQLKMFMFACISVNLLHSKLAKNDLNLTVSNSRSCRMVVFHCLFYKTSKLLHLKSYIF